MCLCFHLDLGLLDTNITIYHFYSVLFIYDRNCRLWDTYFEFSIDLQSTKHADFAQSKHNEDMRFCPNNGHYTRYACAKTVHNCDDFPMLYIVQYRRKNLYFGMEVDMSILCSGWVSQRKSSLILL